MFSKDTSYQVALSSVPAALRSALKICKEERKNGRLVRWRKGRNGRRKSSALLKQREMWHFLGRLALVVTWLCFRTSGWGLWWIQKVLRRLLKGLKTLIFANFRKIWKVAESPPG